MRSGCDLEALGNSAVLSHLPGLRVIVLIRLVLGPDGSLGSLMCLWSQPQAKRMSELGQTRQGQASTGVIAGSLKGVVVKHEDEVAPV